MKLLGFFAFMFALGFAFIFGFAWGVLEGTKRALENLVKKGYKIVPPKEEV